MAALLAVTAHPDDECFVFGGALALHAARGGKAGLLCLTDGQAGRTGGRVEPAALGPVRREELRRAAQVLGVEHLFTPGLADGGLAEVADEEGVALVRAVADDFGADALLTFGPEGASGHADHKACWRWTLGAAAGRRVYAATFPRELDLPGGASLPVTAVVDVSSLGDRKRRAFLAHETQQDHLGLLDRILAALGGREYYHRVHPPWREGDPLESAIL